jgi:hypothetical protein
MPNVLLLGGGRAAWGPACLDGPDCHAAKRPAPRLNLLPDRVLASVSDAIVEPEGTPMTAAMFTVRPLDSSAPLSKSKFVHGMQCPLYVWLEVRTDAPRLEPDAFTQALFAAGHEVGEYARQRGGSIRAATRPGTLGHDAGWYTR